MNANRWISKLERKYRRYSIKNLMTIVVGGMGIVFLLDMLLSPIMGISISGLLSFQKGAIMRGQVWRPLTFVFVPPVSNPMMLLFTLYFYWMIGSALESQWGSFRFNLYYLCGILGSVLCGFLTGYATNTYLNMSLFLGFALMYPDYQVNLFFFIPVKMKVLAFVAVVGLLIAFFQTGLYGKIALAAAMANVLIFFWSDMKVQLQNTYRRYQWKKTFR